MSTHFDSFGLPARFDLDLNFLERRFRELSLEHHPDRVRGDPHQRRLAVDRSTALNEGFRVLKDPVRRAFYLLKLHGVDLDHDASPELRTLPPAFLEEVLELREKLEEARGKKDLAAAQALASQVTAMQGVALGAAQDHLRRLETGPDEAALHQAAHQLARLRYFTRFLEEVAILEEEALG